MTEGEDLRRLAEGSGRPRAPQPGAESFRGHRA